MQEKQVLQCKSAKSTMARFSKLSNPTKTHEKLNGPLADNSNSGSFIIVPKHNDMIAEERVLALPASIPLTLLTLLTSSEVLPCTHRAAMSLDIFQRSELARVRSPPLFEQDRDRGKLQGV